MARRHIADENDETRQFVVRLVQYAEIEVAAFDQDSAVEQAKVIASATSEWELDTVEEL